mgnify:CR=1 FL=1
MRRKSSEIQVFSISFLDVLSCALGSVLILLIIVPISPPKPEVEQTVIQRLKAVITSVTTQNHSLEEQIKQLQEENKKVKQESNKTIPQPKKQPTPSLFGLPLKANNAIFIIDVSGSMSWQWNNLYETIESLLRSCDVKKYRFIFFDSIVYQTGKYWSFDWLTGSDGNKDKTLKHINDNLYNFIEEDPAGTNSDAALYEALQYKEGDVIYFVTDGYPTVGETNISTILSRVKYSNTQGAIINCIMVGLPGAGVNYYGSVTFDPKANPKELYDFLHDLADQNGGVYVGR